MGKIDINFRHGKDFKPRIKHKTVWVFYTGIGFFLCMAISIPFWAGEEAIPAALSMGGLCLFMLIIIWLQTSGKTIRYHVNQKGIYLKRSWIKRLYPYEKILEVKKVDEQEAEQVAKYLDDKRVDGINSMDIKEAFGGQMDFGKLIMFSSVQFVGTQTGGDHFVTSNAVNTDGEFVLISLDSGEKYLISPIDVGGVLAEVYQNTSGRLGSLNNF